MFSVCLGLLKVCRLKTDAAVQNHENKNSCCKNSKRRCKTQKKMRTIHYFQGDQVNIEIIGKDGKKRKYDDISVSDIINVDKVEEHKLVNLLSDVPDGYEIAVDIFPDTLCQMARRKCEFCDDCDDQYEMELSPANIGMVMQAGNSVDGNIKWEDIACQNFWLWSSVSEYWKNGKFDKFLGSGCWSRYNNEVCRILRKKL